METSACIKALVFATTQYYNNKTDSTLVHLQRQLDVMIGVTAQRSNRKFFLPPQLAATECLTCLVDVLSDPSTVSHLSLKCIQLLGNIVNEPLIRSSLYKDFNLYAALTSLIINNSNKASDSLVLDSVQLLQKITYGQSINFYENYEDLISYLVKQILLPESSFTLPCLGLLANLCRNSNTIQVFVNNMEVSRKLKLTLIPFLSHNNLSTIIFSLSILTSLCLQEELGDKLFNANNINQTFKMMFNIVINGESGTSRLYAIDLFIDLMKNSKIQQLLAVFTHLSASLKEVFVLLGSCSAMTATKVFELLISFCSVKSIRKRLSHYLFDLSQYNDPAAPKNVTTLHLEAVTKWISASLDSEIDAACKALELCIEILEELNQNSWLKNQEKPVESLLIVLSKSLNASPPVSHPTSMKSFCQKQILVIKTLSNICQESMFVEKMLSYLQVGDFQQLLEFHFNNNTNFSVNHTRKDAKSQNWGDLSVSFVLSVLNFLSFIQVPTIKSFLENVMQNSNIVQFLSMGFLSSDRNEVHTAINLLSIGSKMESFPHLALGDALAANNIVREQDHKVLNNSSIGWNTNHIHNSYSTLPSNHIAQKVPGKCSSIDDENIENLIEKLQTGLEVKDVKLSEMIDVYEHKLQSMQMREQQLQDLLEAKTLAVIRADRVISQYRSRRAEAEAENCSIRNMVRTFEKRTEEYQEKLKNMTVLETNYNNLLAEKQKLALMAEEHMVLKEKYNEQSQKLENAEHMLHTLRQEHTSLTEMHEILRKHHESLKQQNEVGLEKQGRLSRQLKESESLVNSLQKTASEIEEQLQKLSKERDDLDEAIEKVRRNLAKTETEKKELQQKITSFELVCQKHESVIKEKTEELERVKNDLNKHEQIAAMIHNLSSSKIPKITP